MAESVTGFGNNNCWDTPGFAFISFKYFSFNSYIGYDVSQTSIDLCSNIFKSDSSKQFINIIDYKPIEVDLTLSLDVIYHLIEDDVFHDYMSKLFDSSKKFVIIYSSNDDKQNNR